MDSKDRDFIVAHSSLEESDVELLNEISIALTGEELDVKDKLKELWNDVTVLSKRGRKQSEWEAFGSDQIIENWAGDIQEQFKEALQYQSSNITSPAIKEKWGEWRITQEDYDKLELLANAADEIFNKILE